MTTTAETVRALLAELVAPVVEALYTDQHFDGDDSAPCRACWEVSPATSDDVAARLRMMGCRGKRGSCEGCPLWAYLDRHGVRGHSVYWGIVWFDATDCMVRIPTVVRECIEDFDATGAYPELLEPCSPHLKCDGCGLRRSVTKAGGLPYKWLLDGKRAPGWTMEVSPGGRRRDWCAACSARGDHDA